MGGMSDLALRDRGNAAAGINVRWLIDLPKLAADLKQKTVREPLKRAGAIARLAARRRIRYAPDREKYSKEGRFLGLRRKYRGQERPARVYSAPGQSPFTHYSEAFTMYKFPLRESIAFNVDDKAQSVVIGPVFSVMHGIAKLHEFGGVRKGRRYAARPFMAPALDAVRDRLPSMWTNSVGNNL